jgi:hypothetical protein
MTADRPARPARRGLDDSLPIDRVDLDERLIALGWATSRTGCALEATDAPAESNRLYTPTSTSARRHWKAHRAGRRRAARQVPVPDGASGLLEFTDGDLTASALSAAAMDAGVEFTTIADFLAPRATRVASSLERAGCGRRQVRPATRALWTRAWSSTPRRRPTRATDRPSVGSRAPDRAATRTLVVLGSRGVTGPGARAVRRCRGGGANRC